MKGAEEFASDTLAKQYAKALDFPLDVFPDCTKRYCLNVAASLATKPDFFAVSVLASASGAIGLSRVIQVKNGWQETVLLYIVLVGKPTIRKHLV